MKTTKQQRRDERRERRVVQAQTDYAYATTDDSPMGAMRRYVAQQTIKRELVR